MFDETNKRADVKYKDKAAFMLITEFVGIRSNMHMYSYINPLTSRINL